MTEDSESQVALRPVDRDNWRDIARLKAAESQREFVVEPSYNLALCCYDGEWHPLAVYLLERVIGFLMWTVDPADDSCWLGGILVDQSYQRHRGPSVLVRHRALWIDTMAWRGLEHVRGSKVTRKRGVCSR
jgi:hypothetical protein